jgi:hypothetical protein
MKLSVPDCTEAAQVMFLQVADLLVPQMLKEVHGRFFEASRNRAGSLGMPEELKFEIEEFCRRSNLVLDGVPAKWAVDRVFWTLLWWGSNKPTPEQMLSAQKGAGPIEPFQWDMTVFRAGVPGLTRSGDRDPWEFTSTYNLKPLPNESDRDFKKRLRTQKSGVEVELAVRARDALKLGRSLWPRPRALRAFQQHLTLAVLFQICGVEVTQILEIFPKWNRSVIDKGINSVLKMVQLTRRRPAKTGRPRKQRKSNR